MSLQNDSNNDCKRTDFSSSSGGNTYKQNNSRGSMWNYKTNVNVIGILKSYLFLIKNYCRFTANIALLYHITDYTVLNRISSIIFARQLACILSNANTTLIKQDYKTNKNYILRKILPNFEMACLTHLLLWIADQIIINLVCQIPKLEPYKLFLAHASNGFRLSYRVAISYKSIMQKHTIKDKAIQSYWELVNIFIAELEREFLSLIEYKCVNESDNWLFKTGTRFIVNYGYCNIMSIIYDHKNIMNMINKLLTQTTQTSQTSQHKSEIEYQTTGHGIILDSDDENDIALSSEHYEYSQENTHYTELLYTSRSPIEYISYQPTFI
jgi:hypothetical protein